MSKSIHIEFAAVNSSIQDLQQHSTEINDILNEVESVYQGLNTSSTYAEIRNECKQVIAQLQQEQTSMNELWEMLTNIQSTYRMTEQRIQDQYQSLGNDAEITTDQSGSQSEANEGEETDEVSTDTLADLLDYLEKSLKQILLGNFTDEVTLLGTLGQVILGLLNLDLPGDIRDLLADLQKIINGEDIAWWQIALDAVALVPLIGALKYSDEAVAVVKNADEVGDVVEDVTEAVVKNADEAEDVIGDTTKAVDKAVDAADDIGDTGKHVDEAVEGGSKTQKPNQVHHYATNKNKTYTQQYKDITDKYGLDLDEDWNKEILPHQGRHPNEYHEFILDEMKNIDNIANGDIDIFTDLYESNIKCIVRENPEMLYKNYWKNLN